MNDRPIRPEVGADDWQPTRELRVWFWRGEDSFQAETDTLVSAEVLARALQSAGYSTQIDQRVGDEWANVAEGNQQ